MRKSLEGAQIHAINDIFVAVTDESSLNCKRLCRDAKVKIKMKINSSNHFFNRKARCKGEKILRDTAMISELKSFICDKHNKNRAFSN